MDVLQEILFPAVEEAKRSIDSAVSLTASADAPLFGDGGLDSMGLVRFIIMVEERIEDRTQIALTLASDKAMSQKSSPFKTLGTLAHYIGECLAEEGFDG
jgi:D-alanine--poly(phosphoribitol) ligase subunit 2